MNKNELCETLSTIYVNDQKFRKLDGELADPFFKILDSIRISEGLTVRDYRGLPKDQQLAYGSRARKLTNLLENQNIKRRDSIMKLQTLLDSSNTEILLKIIKEYGYPNKKQLSCKNYSAPFLIFVHSPKKYWSEIKKTIDKEKKEGRISQGDYDYIYWHINGRVGNPIINEEVRIQELDH